MRPFTHVHAKVADGEVNGVVGHSTLDLLPVEAAYGSSVYFSFTEVFAPGKTSCIKATISIYFAWENYCVVRESRTVKAIALHLELKTAFHLGDLHLTLCGGIVAQLVTPCALECDTSGEVCCHCNDSKHQER